MEKNKANPKVSIIVPVYRAEKYVSKCIDSILNQTYPNWELILVDDGSPDNSGSICDEYAAKDSRIRVFHKENGGVSSARNIGIENAVGNWLMFVDADDWLSTEAISSCMPFFDENEIIRFSVSVIRNEKNYGPSMYELKDMPREKYISRIVSIDTILGVVGGLYRKELFDNNRIRFDTSLICGEDWLVLLECVLHANQISFIIQPLYYYSRINETSATFDFHFDAALSSVNAQRKIAALLSEMSLSTQYCRELASGKCKCAYSFIAHCLLEPRHVTRLQFKEYFNTVHLTIRDILDARVGFKMKLLLLFSLLSLFRRLVVARLPHDTRIS